MLAFLYIGWSDHASLINRTTRVNHPEECTVKALLLAGGYATRLMPLSRDTPKPLLTIKGRAAMDYVLDSLKGIQIDGVFVLTNRRFAESFESWRKERRINVEFLVEDSSAESEKPGAIAAILNAIRALGDDDYIVIAGDNVFTMSLGDMYRYFKSRDAPVVGIYDVRETKLATMYSTVETDEKGRIVKMLEKPKHPEGTLIVTCIYILPKGIGEMLQQYLASGGHKDSPGYFVEWLSKRTVVYGYPVTGKWFDVGTTEALERAQKEI